MHPQKRLAATGAIPLIRTAVKLCQFSVSHPFIGEGGFNVSTLRTSHGGTRCHCSYPASRSLCLLSLSGNRSSQHALSPLVPPACRVGGRDPEVRLTPGLFSCMGPLCGTLSPLALDVNAHLVTIYDFVQSFSLMNRRTALRGAFSVISVSGLEQSVFGAIAGSPLRHSHRSYQRSRHPFSSRGIRQMRIAIRPPFITTDGFTSTSRGSGLSRTVFHILTSRGAGAEIFGIGLSRRSSPLVIKIWTLARLATWFATGGGGSFVCRLIRVRTARGMAINSHGSGL